MGFIRSSLFFFVSVFLIVSLFLTGFFYMVSMSLDYNIVKDHLVKSSSSLIEESGITNEVNSRFQLMQEACSIMPSYNLSLNDGTFVIPCEVINQGENATYNHVIENFVMKDYYRDYNCSIIECFSEKKNPNFLFSEKTKDYATNKFYFFIFVSFILSGVLFLLAESKSSFPIFIGVYLSLLSFPFLKLDSALSFFDNKIILNFVSIFITRAYGVFAKFIFFGILFILIGIIWKLVYAGSKINKFFSWIKERRKKKIINTKNKSKNTKSIKKNKKGEITFEISEEGE